MQCSESVATCIDTGVWTSNFWSEYATQLKELGAVLIVHAGSWFCSDCARRYRVLFYCARRYRVLFWLCTQLWSSVLIVHAGTGFCSDCARRYGSMSYGTLMLKLAFENWSRWKRYWRTRSTNYSAAKTDWNHALWSLKLLAVRWVYPLFHGWISYGETVGSQVIMSPYFQGWISYSESVGSQGSLPPYFQGWISYSGGLWMQK